jgi:hypothetical protein
MRGRQLQRLVSRRPAASLVGARATLRAAWPAEYVRSGRRYERPMRRAVLIGVGVGIPAVWLAMSELATTHCRFDRQTEGTARVVRMATVAWLTRHPGRGCPNVQALHLSGDLDPAASAVDEWGRAMRVTCDGAETVVRSAGLDGAFGTRDDIVVPKGASHPSG